MGKHFRLPGRVLEKLGESGIQLHDVLRNAGLPRGLLDGPRVFLSTEEFFAFWRGIGEVSADPAFGLRLGTESTTEHLDPIVLAALATDNFGEAIDRFARYKQLTCPEEIVRETEGGAWSIQFRWLLAQGEEPHILTDLCFAYILCMARLGSGRRVTPLEIHLTRPRANARTLETHFGCPVVFGAARNAMVFQASAAELPFITRNAELLAMLAPQLDGELKKLKGQESFSDRVRAAIQKKLAGKRPKMGEIARELHTSSRTLQRRLLEAGYSFQQVLEEARHQLARHYLANSMLELNDAAYLLGYEDVGSFVRAFRGWEGVPPGHWRESQRPEGFC